MRQSDTLLLKSDKVVVNQHSNISLRSCLINILDLCDNSLLPNVFSDMTVKFTSVLCYNSSYKVKHREKSLWFCTTNFDCLSE